MQLVIPQNVVPRAKYFLSSSPMTPLFFSMCPLNQLVSGQSSPLPMQLRTPTLHRGPDKDLPTPEAPGQVTVPILFPALLLPLHGSEEKNKAEERKGWRAGDNSFRSIPPFFQCWSGLLACLHLPKSLHHLLYPSSLFILSSSLYLHLTPLMH